MSAATPRIFVSHSHKDDGFGVRLIRDLMRVLPEPDAVWYDSHGGLHGGVTWWTTIVHEITTRNIFIVILTPDAVNSEWVKDEINLAWQEKNARGMLILPILRLACTIRADIQTLQVLDFQSSRDYDLAFNELLAAIGITAPQAVHQPPSPPQPDMLARFLTRYVHSTKQCSVPQCRGLIYHTLLATSPLFQFFSIFITPYGATLLISLGNVVASLMFGTPVSCISRRSMPIAKPPCGGMPYLNVSR